MTLLPRVDVCVIGAGIFGAYAAQAALTAGRRVHLTDADPSPFQRASRVNQARLHLGYHYPRSIGTALQAAAYFDRFKRDHAACIAGSFEMVYATSESHSFMSADGFDRFCDAAGIPARRVDPRRWFAPGSVSGAWSCDEVSFDPTRLAASLWARIDGHAALTLTFGRRIIQVARLPSEFDLTFDDGTSLRAQQVVNATYAGLNAVLELFGEPPVPVRYEQCEVVLGTVPPPLREVGLTVMDGPFFSVMPYGRSALHSLTAVPYTPRATATSTLPEFECQAFRSDCTGRTLANCNTCPVHPPSGWVEMRQLATRFVPEMTAFQPIGSMFAVRPVITTSSVDDSRPTLLLRTDDGPELVSVLSGKANTFYDLDELW